MEKHLTEWRNVVPQIGSTVSALFKREKWRSAVPQTSPSILEFSYLKITCPMEGLWSPSNLFSLPSTGAHLSAVRQRARVYGEHTYKQFAGLALEPSQEEDAEHTASTQQTSTWQGKWNKNLWIWVHQHWSPCHFKFHEVHGSNGTQVPDNPSPGSDNLTPDTWTLRAKERTLWDTKLK